MASEPKRFDAVYAISVTDKFDDILQMCVVSFCNPSTHGLFGGGRGRRDDETVFVFAIMGWEIEMLPYTMGAPPCKLRINTTCSFAFRSSGSSRKHFRPVF
jgi:hypothetical protein